MRKLLALAAAAWLAVRLLRRRRVAAPTVVVGYADGSSFTLEPDAREHDRLIDLGRVALTR